MTLHFLLEIAGGAWIVVSTISAIECGRRYRALVLRDARDAAAALTGCVKIDGFDLPLPSDERWKFLLHTLKSGSPVNCLHIARAVFVTEDHVFVNPPQGTAEATMLRIPASKEIAFYARDVWKQYLNRVARQAVT